MRIDTFYSSSYNDPGQLPHLIIDQTKHGEGVKARMNLAKGSVLVNISGPSVSYGETIAMGNRESYCLQVGINKYIKPQFPFFLFNHSCVPNCGINELLQLITTREVKVGEELNWDYSTSMLERGWKLNCTCGQPACRKVIKDFDLLPKQLQLYYMDNRLVLPFIRDYMMTTK